MNQYINDNEIKLIYKALEKVTKLTCRIGQAAYTLISLLNCLDMTK